jgi:hypothetical protein
MADNDKDKGWFGDDDKAIARAIREAGDDIQNGLLAVAKAIQGITPPKADKLTAILVPQKGAIMFRKTEAPLTVNVGTTGTTTVVETAAGVIVPITGPITFASDNPAVATYDASGNWVAVAEGVANMSQKDESNGLTDTTQLTVQVAPPPPADTLIGTLVPNVARRR